MFRSLFILLPSTKIKKRRHYISIHSCKVVYGFKNSTDVNSFMIKCSTWRAHKRHNLKPRNFLIEIKIYYHHVYSCSSIQLAYHQCIQQLLYYLVESKLLQSWPVESWLWNLRVHYPSYLIAKILKKLKIVRY